MSSLLLSQAALNSFGVSYPSELCGRIVLYSRRNHDPFARASATDSNSIRSRNSSRNRLWNDSIYPFSQGLPRPPGSASPRPPAASRQRLADELRAVVAADPRRRPATADHPGHDPPHVGPRQRTRRVQHQALPSVFVHQRQPLERTLRSAVRSWMKSHVQTSFLNRAGCWTQLLALDARLRRRVSGLFAAAPAASAPARARADAPA